jgi:penicillin-binding protein 2
MGLKKYFLKNRVSQNIEAEEIFLDSEAIRSLEEKGKLEKPIKERNFIFFYILIVVCLLGLFLRAGFLQIVKGNYYRDLARGNKLRVYQITAPRGIIYDKNGIPLVYNVPRFDLVVTLNDFFDNPPERQNAILKKMASVLNSQEGQKDSSLSDISDEERTNQLRQEIEKARGEVSQLVLVKGIERSAALVLEGLVGDWPGVRVEKNAQRYYPFGQYFAHLLGYTGQVDRSDLENYTNYSLTDQIGKDGLECQYEEVLRGKPGQEQTEVDSLGRTQKILAGKLPESGKGLVLFIDGKLQEKLYQSLEKTMNRLSGPGSRLKRAAAVVVDPNNGGVLAMVSLPSFDNNLFAEGISKSDLSALENNPYHPFLNRVLSGLYPPGSTIKPLIGAAALEEKIVGKREQINCQGGLSIVNQYNPQIVYYFPDWKVHGLTDIIKAIAESCNVFFYSVGGGYGQVDGLGVDRIRKYLEYFGLGQPTQIDLPDEEAGLIPDKSWKAERGEEWFLGDTYHLAIGQGDILVTPLQMAMAVSSIANKGILYRPRLVDKIIDLDKNPIEDFSAAVVRENFIEPANLEIVRQGMRQAVVSGSARALAGLPVEAAGKTGTAQFGNQGKTHAWFVGFAPYDNPEIVLVILVEGGGEGHRAAVPVAKEVLEWYFNQ